MTDEPTKRRFLTVEQAAEELNVKSSLIRGLISSEELRAIQVGGRGLWRVGLQDLEDYIAKHTGAQLRTLPLASSMTRGTRLQSSEQGTDNCSQGNDDQNADDVRLKLDCQGIIFYPRFGRKDAWEGSIHAGCNRDQQRGCTSRNAKAKPPRRLLLLRRLP